MINNVLSFWGTINGLFILIEIVCFSCYLTYLTLKENYEDNMKERLEEIHNSIVEEIKAAESHIDDEVVLPGLEVALKIIDSAIESDEAVEDTKSCDSCIWHKLDEELPDNSISYLCCLEALNEARRYEVIWYNTDDKAFERYDSEYGTFDKVNNVIAWTKIGEYLD